MPDPQKKLAKAFLGAAEAGDVDKLRELLAAGVPVETADHLGRSTLYQAVAYGHREAAQLLLDAGADIHIAPEGQGGVLMDAACSDDPNLVRLLIERGADVNRADRWGFTPLMMAAYQGSVDIVRILLDAGADPNARGKFGMVNTPLTAFEWARRENKKKVAELLAGLAGKPEAAAEPADEALQRFGAVAAEPAYQEAVARLAQLSAKPPAPVKRQTGVYRAVLKSFKVLAKACGREGQEDEAVLGGVLDDFRSKGYLLVLNEPWAEGEPAQVALYPTADKYAVLLACGTDGANYGHSTRDIVAWLRALDREQPFHLAACGRDFVVGRFTGPVKDAAALAKRMVQFCPDLVDGEMVESDADVARLLAESRSFSFWWD